MKKIITILFNIIFIFTLSCCNNNKSNDKISINISSDNIKEQEGSILSSLDIITPEKSEDTNMNNELVFKINDEKIDVSWEDNASVDALKEIAKNGLEINMNMYGGFEQVGPLGKILPSNDIQITTNPGDIVLYSSNQIVIFYGQNTWRYTKLGHINKNKTELEELLGNKNVTITINIK